MKKLFLSLIKKQNAAGFTLIETLMAIFIFTVIMGAASSYIVSLYRTNSYAWQKSAAINEARRGIETMVKEIRAAREAETGAFPIELADDKQFIFYSDIDNDGETEKVRYFLTMASSTNSGNDVKSCSAVGTGDPCSVNFPNFFTGNLQSAAVTVSAEGDLDQGSSNREDVSISAGGIGLGTICTIASPTLGNCGHCAGVYSGTTTYNVTSIIGTNTSITFTADGNSKVTKECPSAGPYDHSMKASFKLSWTAVATTTGTTFNKGVTEPTGNPVEYPSAQEKISILTSYVRNAPPIFKYFDADGNEIATVPARLVDTKLIELDLIINVDPNRPPDDFSLQSSVQLRNLKEE